MDTHPNASTSTTEQFSETAPKLELPTPAPSPVVTPLVEIAVEEPVSAEASQEPASQTEEKISEPSEQAEPTSQEPEQAEPEPTFDYSHVVVDERDKRLFALMKIEPNFFFRTLFSPYELALDRFLKTAPFMTTGHQSVVYYKIREDVALSCVNWKGRCYITGTDIVRLLVHRFEDFTGKPPHNMKKFEEGIFSDLRRLSPPQDCILEGTRSDFLVFLFNMDCVRSKKKQKVFYWERFQAVAHNIFCDAVDRELARLQMAKAVGMSVDEFIKSGVVPTGTSSQNDPTRYNLPFDWTVRCLQLAEDNNVAILNIDQIHVIRNDVSNLFGRFLRMQLTEPSRNCNEGEDAISKAFQQRVGTGHFVPPKVEQPLAQYENDDEYESRPVQRRPAKRKTVSPKNTPPMTPKQRSANFRLASRYRAGVFNRDEDDNYSVSTISSNEEEIRMHYRAPEPVPTFIEHGYDEEYYYYQNHGGAPFGYHPGYDPHGNARYNRHPAYGPPAPPHPAYHQHPQGYPLPPHPSQMPVHHHMPPHGLPTPVMQPKRLIEEEKPIYESDAAKRLKALQESDRDAPPPNGKNAYEAAYILLGISRG